MPRTAAAARRPEPTPPTVVTPSSRRRRPTGGPRGAQARSGDTRDRLVAAALEVFGEVGFETATTRAIAGRAGVTLPVLAYHFGHKAGLYQACAEHITARLDARLGPALHRVQETLGRADLSRGELVGLLGGMLSTMAQVLVGDDEPRHWVGFILREQAHPTAAFDTIYEGVMSRVVGFCAGIVGRLLGLPAEREEVRLRALGLLGQVFMLRTGQAAMLRTLGWPDFGGERLVAVCQSLRKHVEAAFGAPGARER